jgi:hypothetical protein
MGWDRAFAATATYAKPEHFETFRRHLDAGWIEEALTVTGTATVRRRRLPVEEVIWVVLGMALFRDRPIEDVVSKLDLALPGGGGTVARSSLSQARGRLGSEPMEWLLGRSASAWAHASAAAHRWRGLSLYGVDGSSLRVPDTPENRAHFGGQSGRKGTESGYPMARLVALMVLRSHILAGVWFGPYVGTNELDPAKELRATIPDNSLTVLDRGFLAASMLLGIATGGNNRHWLTRAKSNSKWRVLRRLGKGDGVDLPRHPRRIQVSGRTGDAKTEDDFAPAGHGALDANGAIAAARGEAFSRVVADRVDGPLHLPAEIGIVPRDDAAESMDGADGLDDVIEDT